MDRQIRRLGIAFVALFAVLFAQVAYVQVIAADRIANEPANAPRQIKAEYAVERGQILASNHTTVLAESTPNQDPDSIYRYVRSYPNGELWGQLTGYYSRIYGRTGLVQREYGEQGVVPYFVHGLDEAEPGVATLLDVAQHAVGLAVDGDELVGRVVA